MISRQNNPMKRPQTIAELADIYNEFGRDTYVLAINNFLDEIYLAKNELREDKLKDEPAMTDSDIVNAYLAAVAERLSSHFGFKNPEWTTASSDRFLKKAWFPKNTGKKVAAILLFESPTSFRRRNIFVSSNALHRASMYSSMHDDTEESSLS